MSLFFLSIFKLTFARDLYYVLLEQSQRGSEIANIHVYALSMKVLIYTDLNYLISEKSRETDIWPLYRFCFFALILLLKLAAMMHYLKLKQSCNYKYPLLGVNDDLYWYYTLAAQTPLAWQQKDSSQSNCSFELRYKLFN